VPFDLTKHKVTGGPVRVLERVGMSIISRGYSVSASGVLVQGDAAGSAATAENSLVTGEPGKGGQPLRVGAIDDEVLDVQVGVRHAPMLADHEPPPGHWASTRTPRTRWFGNGTGPGGPERAGTLSSTWSMHLPSILHDCPSELLVRLLGGDRACASTRGMVLARLVGQQDCLSGHTDAVMSVALSPGGRRLAAISLDRIAVLMQCFATRPPLAPA